MCLYAHICFFTLATTAPQHHNLGKQSWRLPVRMAITDALALDDAVNLADHRHSSLESRGYKTLLQPDNCGRIEMYLKIRSPTFPIIGKFRRSV